MKKITIILLVVVLLAQIFSNAVIVVNYVVNRDYIAKTLCENRNKPKMHCNGKCYLMKQLRKENSKEKSPLSILKIKTQVVYFEKITINSFDLNLTAENTFVRVQAGSPVSVSSSVFHPPTV